MRPILLITIIACFITSCKKEAAEATPPCPECWDPKALCIDAECQCPEGAIAIEQEEMFVSNQPYPPEGQDRTFCVLPNKLTFIARFPMVGCYDTLAIRMPFEPLEYETAWDSKLSPPIEPEVPQRIMAGNSSSIYIEEREEGLFMIMTSLWGSRGFVTRHGCLDTDTAFGERDGVLRADFRGYMTHPDTISGYMEFRGSGTYEQYNGDTLHTQFIRTLPY